MKTKEYKYSQKMKKACRDTVAAYRRLISDKTGKEAEKWHNYGSIGTCRLCNASSSSWDMPVCYRCPLGRYSTKQKLPASDLDFVPFGCSEQGMRHTYKKLQTAIAASWGNKHIVKAAKNRLRVLLRAFKSEGIDIPAAGSKKEKKR